MKKITIKNIKHIEKLEFELPSRSGAYVLTGSNGSGKTTLMTCLLRIGYYRAFQDNFKTGSNRMDNYNGEIIYEVNGKEVSYHHAITRWPPRPRKNSKLFQQFGYPDVRFLPATGNRLFIQDQKINPSQFRAVDAELKQDLNNLLETDKFNNLRFVQTGSSRGPGGGSQRWKRAYVIKKVASNNYYSEKNFSLGEVLILNTLLLIKDVRIGSMLLIDELEMALHPRVQVRLLRYLEEKANEKDLTIILSTHSSSIIKSASKIIYLENNGTGLISVNKNCYPAVILRELAIEEDIQPDYVFLVEDDMAEMLLKEMINYYFQKNSSRTIPIFKILPIGGYPNMLRFAERSKDYLFNSTIGQYLFPDLDVEEVKNLLTQKGNSRSLDEQKLFVLFQNFDAKINYLPITPEIGIWTWITENNVLVQQVLSQYYQGSTFNLTDLIDTTEQHFTNNSDDNGGERKKAKRRIKYFVKTLSERVNESSKRINQYLFTQFVQSYYSDSTNWNEAKGIFGRIFNTRGN